jgi:DNA replication protein DnaC
VTTPDESSNAYEEWLAEDRERRLNRFYARRPAAFTARGKLDLRVHQWLESLVTRQARTLLLGGPTGTGKSWSIWKSVETLLVNGWRGEWEVVSAYELSRIIAPPVDEERLDGLATVDLLAIDDIGSVNVTDWAAAHLLGIVDHRWSHHLPTIVTTNTPKLGELLGERIASRLADGATVITLDGPDRRRAAQ